MLLMLLGCGSVLPVHAQNLVVFSNVHVVPMDRERVLDAQDVVVEAGNIRSLSRHVAHTWPKDTLIIDGTGKYLIPGLSDLHVHMDFGDSEQLKLYVVHGVTTVLNLRGRPELLHWRKRIATGEMIGPNFYTSGPILDGDPPTNRTHVIVRNRAEAERCVHEQAMAGYDFIKPYSALSQDAFLGIVETARREHIRLVGHVSWNVGVQETVEAGQDAIAHIEELYRYFVDRHQELPADTRPDPAKIPALGRFLQEHGVWVITTLSANRNILEQATRLPTVLQRPEMKFVPASYLVECRTDDPYARRGDDWVQQNKIMVPFLYRIAAGLRDVRVQMIAGTDATNPIQVPGISLHEELADLVKAGLTPYEALRTSTRNPAEFLRRANVAGTIAPGMRAELVLLRGNPLDDIHNTARVAGVMVQGRWLNDATLETMKKDLQTHLAHE